MKKVLKVLSLVLVFVLALAPVVSLAVEGFDITPSNDFEGSDGIKQITGKALGFLQIVGYGIALIMVFWLGIQWMLAQPAKKAELKGKMWSMAIGIALLVGGVTIVKFVWDLANNATSTLSNVG